MRNEPGLEPQLPNIAHTKARLTRRNLLVGASGLIFAPTLFAQQNTATIAVRKLHSFGLRVTDLQRSLEFYQGLFGSAVIDRKINEITLRIGTGPYYFKLTEATANESPSITYIGISVIDLDLRLIQSVLSSRGVIPGQSPGSSGGNLNNRLRSWTINRELAGNRGEATRDLFFADPDGIVYQLVHTSDCGGGGQFGEQCAQPEPSPVPGLFELTELSHFTNRVHNRDLSNEFHTSLFGLQFQAYQGPSAPVIGVGDRVQFLMYTGGNEAGPPAQAGRIDHVCLGMENFVVDEARSRLDSFGLTPRESPDVTPPMAHWVSMRMPNRGGADGGTPELYFSDPDGIRVQLQDPSYCGGTGYLGDDCSATV